ncbi:N-terminal C2 in EEIG1 and EHBP1 proteins-domain-containing protein [Sporodiniella umbellata]|nr:N-terminal C2 in EEIG1 and EHBP1 proteins-domain-containing protein [Sporodiniella umbellata]
MMLSNLFVSKQRKVDFSIQLTLHDLSNVPLVSGLYYVKWRLKNAAQSSGSTVSSPIRDHDIFWDHSIHTLAHLVISKENILGPCELKLQVFQEVGGTNTIVSVGSLKVNLSEYANHGRINSRFLLDDCKFNSTIKISFRLDQVTETDISYQNPPLEKQQITVDIPSTIINDRPASQSEQKSSTD